MKIKNNKITKDLTEITLGRKSNMYGTVVPIPIVIKESLQQDIKWLGENNVIKMLNVSLRSKFVAVAINAIRMSDDGKLNSKLYKEMVQSELEGRWTLSRIEQELNGLKRSSSKYKKLVQYRNIIHKKYKKIAQRRKERLVEA